MRELNHIELTQVSGGFQGTVIPFTSRFIPGANWPGGGSGAAVATAWSFNEGYKFGGWIYTTITDGFGMSPGEAAYLTVHSK